MPYLWHIMILNIDARINHKKDSFSTFKRELPHITGTSTTKASENKLLHNIQHLQIPVYKIHICKTIFQNWMHRVIIFYNSSDKP